MQRLILCLLALMTPMTPAAAENRQPAYVLQLPATVRDLFVAETGSATLYRFAHDDGALTLAETSYMSIGENGDGKEIAWDRKSPLGIFFVVDRLDTTRLHEKYGVMAFPLDYPNILDRQAGRSGDGIWIHGVDAGGGRRPERDTDGCLALPNENLVAMQAHFVPLLTPVVVTRQLRWSDGSGQQALRDELREAVLEWAAALGAAEPGRYFALYDDEFTYRGMSHAEWRAFRDQQLQARERVEIVIDELILLAEPGDEALYLSRFEQRQLGSERRFATTKRLYWRRDASGALKIVAEDNG